MFGDTSDLDILLAEVNPQRSTACIKRLAALEGVPSGGDILFSCPAHWSTRYIPKLSVTGPRHQTLRRGGRAASYHRPIELTRGKPGKLVMMRDYIVLEATDTSIPPTQINTNAIRRVSFYADCVEIIHEQNLRTLVCCSGIDALDLKFEAYYRR